MRFERRRRNNGNLYPLTAQDRRERRGSYKLHEREFTTAVVTPTAITIIPKPTTWEKIVAWFRETFGGSYPGGDRLL